MRDHVRPRRSLNFAPIGELTLKNINRPVEAFILRDIEAATASTPMSGPTGIPLVVPEKPSLAVLPLVSMSSDPDDAFFAQGISADITTQLSRKRSLFVIARQSSSTYAGKNIATRQIGRELGVRYIVEGSVRRSGQRARISVELVEAETGRHLWADRFDRDIADVFAVQDEISAAITKAVDPAVGSAEQQLALRKPAEHLGAWEAYQRARWLLASNRYEDRPAALDLLRKSVELDAAFSLSHQELANYYLDESILFWKLEPLAAADRATPFAQRAVKLDPTDAGSLTSNGFVAAVNGQLEWALTWAEEALALDLNSTDAHRLKGSALNHLGHWRDALDPLRAAIRLNPRDPRTWWTLTNISHAHYFLGNYKAVLDICAEILEAAPHSRFAYRDFAAALGQLGQRDDARAVAARAKEVIAPVTFEELLRFRGPWLPKVDWDQYADGWRKAGFAVLSAKAGSDQLPAPL